MVLSVNADYFLDSVNQLISVMVKGFFFAVRTELLNFVQTTFGLKGLIWGRQIHAPRLFALATT
jgi:hypothetical protein